MNLRIVLESQNLKMEVLRLLPEAFVAFPRGTSFSHCVLFCLAAASSTRLEPL